MTIQDNRTQRLAMIADWQQSGKSKRAYCKENGINEAVFYYWLERSDEKKSKTGKFIAIEEETSQDEIELIYPNGVRLKVANNLALLSQLIKLY
ncbi:IS66 family insertion sequence element accessory protein TnpA [Paenimyroides viscosum]|uniref:IS66 family insertion sequence element accessory protein TnpB n=1 Tax=Paenimyroides viscosum TaxID=2488729 RepID=A0A3P1AU71_9FLAO|nr:hypothetical protein [Paenimyroides viscosum]RRA92425.1 IS66 family insertion sequence hypothetical protein [Paenimyroides viscosum]